MPFQVQSPELSACRHLTRARPSVFLPLLFLSIPVPCTVILPPANSYGTVMLFSLFIPALLHPLCCSLPHTIVGPTRSQHQSGCQLDVEQDGVGVTSSGWLGVQGRECRWDWSRDRALALLRQSLAVASLAARAEIFISMGSAAARAHGGSSRPAELHRALWPARGEGRHFLQGYWFWESSKISGSQF